MRAALAALAGFPGRCVIFPIKLYRRFISPLKGTPTCRFTPTCSEYAIEAIKEWGAVVGLALAAWRVLRCNPFGGCGHDPVPKRRRRVTKDTDGTSDGRSDM
ncbi:MAG: membrane protein insertion efficiency factor YidD [Clostridia bacterium]|nr:membrane protein insertion efficiency factor YidD [Clostridia bacterium]